jgi:cell wall-associated NlpC family hydrolase
MTTDLRYPIGKFIAPASHTPESRAKMIGEIAAAPGALRAAVKGLSEKQLETPYREGGWTVRQVAHHIADSHMNASVRLRLALTEDNPTVKPYNETLWAELSDSKTVPVDVSLALVDALHARWVVLLKSMTPAQWARTYSHPEYGKVTMEWVLAQYSWHGKHHVAQITGLRERNGW